VDAVAPYIAHEEAAGDGLWCLVDGEMTFVLADGGTCATQWDDALMAAQYARWVKAHPE
jgi:hypothetical protein